MIDFEKTIGAYVTLRDWLEAQDKLHAERMKPMKLKLEALNGVLLTALNTTGQDNAKTKAGTAYRKQWTSATIKDKDAFRRHVIGTEDWDLLDWRANKTAVAKLVEETQHAPPGVDFSRGYDVGVRRPGKED